MQDPSFVFHSAKTCPTSMEEECLKNAMHMLLCPHRPTSVAAGDQLAIPFSPVLESPCFNSSLC